jgi:hypothetical protein
MFAWIRQFISKQVLPEANDARARPNERDCRCYRRGIFFKMLCDAPAYPAATALCAVLKRGAPCQS